MRHATGLPAAVFDIVVSRTASGEKRLLRLELEALLGLSDDADDTDQQLHSLGVKTTTGKDAVRVQEWV